MGMHTGALQPRSTGGILMPVQKENSEHIAQWIGRAIWVFVSVLISATLFWPCQQSVQASGVPFQIGDVLGLRLFSVFCSLHLDVALDDSSLAPTVDTKNSLPQIPPRSRYALPRKLNFARIARLVLLFSISTTLLAPYRGGISRVRVNMIPVHPNRREVPIRIVLTHFVQIDPQVTPYPKAQNLAAKSGHPHDVILRLVIPYALVDAVSFIHHIPKTLDLGLIPALTVEELPLD
jgi:hypothetical protein